MKSGAQSFTNSTLNEEEGRGSSSNLHSLNVFLALMISAACFMSGLLLLPVYVHASTSQLQTKASV